jgi:hypothetical protein
MKNSIFYLLIAIISFVFLFNRFWGLSTKLEFRLDQGIHLLETYQMVVDHKIRLIGSMVTSKSFEGRNFYIGGNYYYALALLGIAGQWDPLKITILYNLVEFFLILFFVYWIKKKFGITPSLVIFLFLATFNYLIVHSHFIWNPHFLIPLAILEVIFLYEYVVQKKTYLLFLALFIFGNAISFHYSAVMWTIFILFTLYKNIKHLNLKVIFVASLGLCLGCLPLLIFELKHNFYNFSTMLYVFSHTSQAGQLTSHYFVFPLLIFILFTIVYLQKKYIKKRNYILISSTLLFIIGYLIPAPSPLDYIAGWSYPVQKKAATLILSSGCPQNYNIASTVGGDTRSYDLRYLLTISKCPPMSVESYPSAQTIFLIAPPHRTPDTETVWEINSFRPFKTTSAVSLNDSVSFYQLNKNDSKTN